MRRLLWPTLFTFFSLAILVSLSIWQVERRTEKLNLVAHLSEQLNAAPVVLSSLRGFEEKDAAALHWRHVILAGRFGETPPLRLYALNEQGTPGHRLIAPFHLDDGATVLIDRGFVPLHFDMRNVADTPEGFVRIKAVLHPAMRLSYFTPEDEPGERLFYRRDYPGMFAALNIISNKDTPALLFDLTTSGLRSDEFPLITPPVVELSNPHLGYAITWAGLALGLLVIYGLYAWREIKREQKT